MNEQAVKYVENQLQKAEFLLRNVVFDEKGARRETRDMLGKVRFMWTEFLKTRRNVRWLIMPGLRGVGKSTIMAQTYVELSEYFSKNGMNKNRILYVSLEDAYENLGISLQDILQAYEKVLGDYFEKLKEPIFLLVDEAQCDPKWGLILKILYDKSPYVFIYCTGSSALELNSNPDIVRRSISERLHPLSFTEYELLQNKLKPIDGLSEKIRQAVYFSESTEQSYHMLKSLEQDIMSYWLTVDVFDIEKYVSFGTFPFALDVSDKKYVQDALNKLIDKIISTDVPRLGTLKIESILMMRRLLFLLADATDVIASSKLASVMEANVLTLRAMLDVLTLAECLIRATPYGSSMTGTKKPTKYCFMSPALRLSLLSLTGQDGTLSKRQGSAWEDLVALHLNKEFCAENTGGLFYDQTSGGCDFILQLINGQEYAIEVGVGEKGLRQVQQTMKQRNIKNGIIISDTNLQISPTKNILFLPFKTFLLM